MQGEKTSYPWSGWPPAAQQRLFRLTLLGTASLLFVLFVGGILFTGTLQQKIQAEKAQYGRVAPLVNDILTLRARQGGLAHQPPLEAIQHIVEDRHMNDYVTSLRTTRLKEGAPGAQVSCSGLTLIMLTDFLQDLRDRAHLQTQDCTLTRNPEDPRLADVHLVLGR